MGATSWTGDDVERFSDEEGVDCCGLGSKVKAVSRPNPVGCVESSATSAMLGMGGRTGAVCETGDDGA